MQQTPLTISVALDKPLANPWVGALWKIFAFGCFALLNGMVRYLSGGVTTNLNPLPVNVIIFFQDLFALLIVLPWVVRQKFQWRSVQYKKVHLLRVICSAAAVIVWYFALFYLPQADAVALSIIGPLLGIIGAKVFLREKMSAKRLAVIVCTFLGAWYVIKPFASFFSHVDDTWGLICVLFSAILFAIAKISTRQLASKGESREFLTAFLLVFIVPVTLVPALFVWVTPSLIQMAWLLLMGFLTAIALYAVSTALAYAEVSFLAPFDFIRFILNVSIGYLAFTELPARWTLGLMVLTLMTLGVLGMGYRGRKRTLSGS